MPTDFYPKKKKAKQNKTKKNQITTSKRDT